MIAKHRPKAPQFWLPSVLIWLLWTTGCMFGDLKKEIQEEQISYAMVGQVEGAEPDKGEVIVLLYASNEAGERLLRFTLPDDGGNFSFVVTPGSYLLAGFQDRDHDQHHDPDEPIGALGHPDPILVPGGPKSEAVKAALTGLNLVLAQGTSPLPHLAVSAEDVTQLSASWIKLGKVVQWDDPVFDEANGSTGYWKPVTFIKAHGAGIYFMAPYDRRKIPILFVHGAVGTPRGWRPLAESLDQQRFQPWVFYYPSGLRLDQIANFLNRLIKQLQLEHGFERLGVVAHSMGGLVSRAFILKHQVDDGLGTVRVFVSISTPWGGVRMADKGLEHAPAAIPSWHDVATQSAFIERIFDDALRPQVPHYLIFGYRGDCSMWMVNNDGTVEIASQLDLRAQEDAAAVWGLDEDHMSILTSERTYAYVNQALASAFAK